MGAIRLTKTNGEKIFVELEDVTYFEEVKKVVAVHFEKGRTVRVKGTFPIVEYIFENCVVEING